jgi:aminomethyltransferase
MSQPLARTPLYDWHADHQAKLVDFAGWAMPVHYGSIVDEHTATRERVGLFDVSHMGRFCFAGPEAPNFLEGLLTRRVDNMSAGQVRYSLVTDESGGVLDDVLVSHLTTSDESFYWLVVNASNRQKLLDWITPRVGDHDVRFTDETNNTAMIAVQGPQSLAIVDAMFDDGKPSELRYFTGSLAVLNGVPVTVSRTGYTGEDGVEFVVPHADAADIWQRLMKAAEELGGGPVGLGARDTLRLEAGMPLYGHELSEEIDPFQARLGFAVNLKNRNFPGRDALAKLRSSPVQLRVGLAMEGKRVPREHYPILLGEQPVGEVSSGTFSPTLQRPLAMAYVLPEASDLGQMLQVDIRGRLVPAEVVELPFYKRR